MTETRTSDEAFVDQHNRIVAAKLYSTAYLNPEIARLQLDAFKQRRLTAAVRRSKHDWIAVLQDANEIVALTCSGFTTEAEANSAAAEALRTLQGAN